jgi:predicted 3-demethylubiquinone-9 3-methyltransferase (glyoxalase superfamily)
MSIRRFAVRPESEKEGIAMVKSGKIKPFLWFDDQAEEAAKLYTSIFPNSEILQVARYPEGSPGPAGKVMTVAFRIDGQYLVALNGGPKFPFTEAVSFVVECADQAEIDYYWEKLTSGGGEPGRCGWLKDRFGLSWQVVPRDIGRYFEDPKTAERVMRAVMPMAKLDLVAIEAAAR